MDWMGASCDLPGNKGINATPAGYSPLENGSDTLLSVKQPAQNWTGCKLGYSA